MCGSGMSAAFVREVLPVIVGPFPEPVHGASMIDAGLAEKMRARGIDVQCLNISASKWRRGVMRNLVRTGRVMRAILAIVFQARLRGARYLMSVDGGPGILYNVILGFFIKAVMRRPLILYHHSSSYVYRSSLLIRCLQKVCGSETRHVMCSAEMFRQYSALYPAKGSPLIISNAAWVQPVVDAAKRYENETLRLGFLSNLGEGKGFQTALETLREIRKRGIPVQLLAAGLLPHPSAEREVAEAKKEFGEDFRYLGRVAGEEKAGFLLSLDYLLFPSLYRHETQSLVVPEALSAGVPVIAYAHRFVGELLQSGGLAVPTARPFAQMAVDWIAEAVGNPALARTRRQEALRQFEEIYADAEQQIAELIAWLAPSHSSGGSQRAA